MDLGFEVIDLPDTNHLEKGDTAPNAELPLVDRDKWRDTELHSLGDTLLVFHSMIGAFPAKYIWNEIQERQWKDVVGCTISTPYHIRGFLDSEDLDHHIYSDPCNTLAQSFGVTHDLDGMTGIQEPRISVFALHGNKVTYKWVSSEWPEFPDYDEIESNASQIIK